VRLPDLVTGGGDAVGVRLPDHPVPRGLARAVGAYPLTSANLSGRRDPLTADDVLHDLGSSVALVLDDGPVRGGVPSTVVRVGTDGTHQVLRSGALTPAEIDAALAGR
jgi:L-threonylcarbamoyladenylate synthase